jgi:hypothetical protein
LSAVFLPWPVLRLLRRELGRLAVDGLAEPLELLILVRHEKGVPAEAYA